jgi:hypothetical protein
VLADHLAVGVVPLDTDVIGIPGPVDGRARVRLGHDEHRQRRACQLARCGRQSREEPGAALGLALAQHAQAGPADQTQAVGFALPNQLVLPVAQQHEVILGQPLEEGLVLRDDRRRQRGRGMGDLADRLLEPPEHLAPVFDRGANVAQHFLDRRRQRGALLGIDQPVDLDVHPRFARCRRFARERCHRLQHAIAIAHHREDRMDEQVQRQALAVDVDDRRVDEERHVIVDDLDHRVTRRPAVFGNRRREHAHLGRPPGALRAELPVRKQCAGQVLDAAVGQVIGVELGKALRREQVERGVPLGRQPRMREREDLLQPFAALGLGGCVHAVSLFSVP